LPPGRLRSKADQVKDAVNMRALVVDESMYGNTHTTAGG
jgi:hypothetical protein